MALRQQLSCLIFPRSLTIISILDAPGPEATFPLNQLTVLAHHHNLGRTLPLLLTKGQGAGLAQRPDLQSMAQPLHPLTERVLQDLSDYRDVDPVIDTLSSLLEGTLVTTARARQILHLTPKLFSISVDAGLIRVIKTKNPKVSLVNIKEAVEALGDPNAKSLVTTVSEISLSRAKLEVSGYFTVSDIVSRYRVSRPTVMAALKRRIFPGALQTSRGWLIPQDSEFPWFLRVES